MWLTEGSAEGKQRERTLEGGGAFIKVGRNVDITHRPIQDRQTHGPRSRPSVRMSIVREPRVRTTRPTGAVAARNSGVQVPVTLLLRPLILGSGLKTQK